MSRQGRAEDVLTARLDRVEQVLRRAWEGRLRSQVMNLPEFEGCYRDVRYQLARIPQRSLLGGLMSRPDEEGENGLKKMCPRRS